MAANATAVPDAAASCAGACCPAMDFQDLRVCNPFASPSLRCASSSLEGLLLSSMVLVLLLLLLVLFTTSLRVLHAPHVLAGFDKE